MTGGVVIDLTALDLSDPAVWCDHHGVSVVDGVATLYKALDADLTAGHRYTPTTYTPGTTVAAADWRADNECGGGLHLGPTTYHATAYYATAARWVAVAVPVADLRPILDGDPKCKVPSCVVLHEVDRYGRTLEAGRREADRRTTCRRGHPWTPENVVYVGKNRTCATCLIDTRARAREARSSKR